MRRIDLRESASSPRNILPRAAVEVSDAIDQVQPIVKAVRNHGAAAVRAATERFDGVTLSRLRVPSDALRSAAEQLDPAIRAALTEAIRRVRLVHADQRREDVTTQVVPGGRVTERWVPVRRVGLYVPGGLAVYPSSVVMNVVPAQTAGVESIAVVSPPQRDTGLPHSLVLAACALLGVDEVYAVGGAQSIAMLAYGFTDGDEKCAPVDLVTGPGNIWVTAAKRLLQGVVGIDAEAGPTEIAILADETANPVYVAADLISQAEHDPAAASVLVTPDLELVEAVEAELERQVVTTKHTERVQEALSGSQSAIVLVTDLEQGLTVVNEYAAEHLEVQTRDAREVAARVRNAGAVFIGSHSPVSLGDYCAGSNHILPTGGSARYSSGLSVQTFLRGTHVIEYDEKALNEVAEHVITLAQAEDLPAHGEAVRVRIADHDQRNREL
jgi:histidinol dehydrogenase